MDEYTVGIKTLTPIWTGDENRRNNSLRETGIIGSLRWWYEALIRGLGGYACDPTSADRCLLDQKKFKKALKEEKSVQEALNEQICPACQLFGCTGWSRKFVLRILNKDGEIKVGCAEANEELILKFIPIKEINVEEWSLLRLTLHFIAEYGAIGGKTVLKPSDEIRRENKHHHRDFGLIEIVESKLSILPKGSLEKYVKSSSRNHMNRESPKWASIKNFWCVKGKYLARERSNRSSFNKVLGRDEDKRKAKKDPSERVSKWLAGSRGESKKVFSFKSPSRTFGFINPEIGMDFEDIRKRLEMVWGKESENNWEFLAGCEILNLLFEKCWGEQNDS
ncbi:MAG TPA: type III-B CRISPR module RAMP protein Cmr1 [Thermotogae bacterium]|nr:type III-B CRISPR module RAMP protein Cmr1 [Thermotogota bacterium]